MTQRERVLNHLQAYGSITPMEAMQRYGVMRLGARVWDLRAAGHPIRRVMVTGKNRFGEPIHYARYEMK